MNKGWRQSLAVWVLASLWLLTTPLAVIIAATAFVNPHLKMEREKIKWGKKMPWNTKLSTHIYWLGSFHLTGRSSTNAVSLFLFPLTLVHRWCQICQKAGLIEKSLLLFVFSTSSEIQIKLKMNVSLGWCVRALLRMPTACEANTYCATLVRSFGIFSRHCISFKPRFSLTDTNISYINVLTLN